METIFFFFFHSNEPETREKMLFKKFPTTENELICHGRSQVFVAGHPEQANDVDDDDDDDQSESQTREKRHRINIG